ncbi:deoxyribonuclease IV [Methanoregula sp.]|uniref:deoxyribonuclease IV n=1 Tax=Methanoregula sp. TaxID=2052170 RepID=UPI002B73DB03|nr:deoxyribonuclease IV [Methanoregula sp.]HVP96218.1 deoxyribonuclease IV [Methanoregula sp.]
MVQVKVGVHVSIAGSLDLAVDRARDAGCDVFQMFSRNPRGWGFKPLSDEDSDLYKKKIATTGLLPVDHMPYLPNLASPKPEIWEKSVQTLTAELDRCGRLGIPYLVTHLGHHLGDGIAGGRARVIKAVTAALESSESGTMLLLENTAGEKNSVGSSFEHIGAIIRGLPADKRIGVCFDTCHAFAAGYELRTEEGMASTLAQFDEQVGLSRLRIIHLNDTKGDRGSGLDRHEHIGMGFIGEEGFRCLLHNPVFSRLPLVCETPVDERRDDRGNIRAVRDLAR